MLFMVGIEKPGNENEAFGIIVPVFEKYGYGCVSAADRQEDILKQARMVIAEMAEEAINEGLLVETLDEGYRDYRDAYPDFQEWLAIEVPVEMHRAKQKRINITMPEPFVYRVDAFVEAHHEFKDRSDFLAKAADKLMQQG